MYNLLLTAHSSLRYIVLVLLLVVIVKSLLGWLNKQNFGDLDNRLSLWLLISAHLQLLLGFGLFFTSPLVQFSGDAMKTPELRYWLVEHNTMMLLAIVAITLGRIGLKRFDTSEGKFRRLFMFNAIALLLIVIALLQSGRGII